MNKINYMKNDIVKKLPIINTIIAKIEDDSINTENQDLDNNKLCFRLICSIVDAQHKLSIPFIKPKSKFEAVLIEFRQLPHLKFLIKNMIIQLGTEWSHTIVCGTLNHMYMKRICNEISPNINIIVTSYQNLNQITYSILLASQQFWDMFHGNKILIYQEDSIIFKKNIDQFLIYDYVGAPWPSNQTDTKNLVGNGGFSLRSKDIMINTINTQNIQNIIPNLSTLTYMNNCKLTICPEDVYFCKTIEDFNIGSIPNATIASEFSTESIVNYDSLGGHNFWLYDTNWINRVLKIHNSIVNFELLDILCKKYKCVYIAKQDIGAEKYLYSIITFFIQQNYKILFGINTTNQTEIENSLKLFNKNEKYSIYITDYNLIFDTKIQSIHFDYFVSIGNIDNIKITAENNILYNYIPDYNNEIVADIYSKNEKFIMFCTEYIPYIKCIELPIICKTSSYESVLIEFNIFPHLEFIIRNTILKLNSNWCHTVICSNSNYNYMVKLCNSISPHIQVIIYNGNKNNILLDIKFWNMLQGKKCLLYNKYTILFKSIDNFIELDYINSESNELLLVTKNVVVNAINKTKLLKIKDIPAIISNYKLGVIATSNEVNNFSNIGNDTFWESNVTWKSLMYKYNILQFNIPKQIEKEFNEHRGGWELIKYNIYNKKLFSIYNENLFYDMLDLKFLFSPGEIIIKPWCGIFHCTPITPNYLKFININNIFSNINFIQSLKTCKGIITLSSYLSDYFKMKFNELKLKINVYTLKHPTETNNIPLFDYIKFSNNSNKKIIQIGQQLRKCSSIYLLDDIQPYSKIWLTGTQNFDKLHKFLSYEMDPKLVQNVEMTYLKEYSEYDNLLVNNVVFIDLYDAAANNTVVECIVRNTPIIINKIPGVVDYLGENYPLYYTKLDEVPKLLTNEQIFLAHQYLLNMNKEEFEIEYFTKKLITLLYRVYQ